LPGCSLDIYKEQKLNIHILKIKMKGPPKKLIKPDMKQNQKEVQNPGWVFTKLLTKKLKEKI